MRLLILSCLLPGILTHSAEDPNVNRLNEILGYTNNSVAPCDDYHKYACGNWATKHKDDDFVEITGLIDAKVNRDLMTLMEELEQRTLDPSSVEAKALSYYRTCRQAPMRTRLGRHYLRLVPPNEQIKWPQFTGRSRKWPSHKFHWLETLARLRLYGLNTCLVQVKVWPDPYNTTNYNVHIDGVVHDEQKKLLGDIWMINMLLRTLGVHSSKALHLARQVKMLENVVGNENEEEQEELTLQELERKTGRGTNWRKYLQIVLGRTVPSDFVVHVTNVDYLVMLVDLLNNWNREVVASYIMLHFTKDLHIMSQSVEAIECIKEVRGNMELATELLYEQRFIGSDKLRQHVNAVQDVFEQLRKKFKQKLEENRIQVPEVQLNMLKAKLRHLRLNFGNMPQHVNRTRFVQEYYTELPLANDRDYGSSFLEIQKFNMRKWFKQLDEPLPDATDFFYISDFDTGISSTPYFMTRQNVIIIPYGILQVPFVQHDVHDIFRFTLMGFVLGHELMHAFDPNSLALDYRGNFNQLLSQIYEESNYASAAACLVRDETDYVDERAADFGGTRLAYDVYFDADSKFNQSQPAFTSIPLKQLFFLNVAQFFCGKKGTSFVGHDDDEIRLRQLVMNFDSFAHSHNCLEERDKMHPTEKCRIW